MRKWLFLAVITVILVLLRKGFLPLAIGLILAYVLDPYVDWLDRRLKAGRLPCIFFAYVTMLAIVALLFVGFADIISGNLQNESIIDMVREIGEYYAEHQELLAEEFGTDWGIKDMTKLMQNLGSGLLKLFIGMIIGVYLLKDKIFFLRLGNQAMHLFLDQKTHGIVREICYEINAVIASFLRGVFIDSVIVAFLSSLALALLKVDFAVFIGCFAGISNVIPYFGPIIGMVPAVITGFADGGLIKAAAAAGALFIIQQVECNLIYPRIIGKSTGLHPLFVLITVSVAGYYGGLLSMVLAVPFAGVVKVLVCKWALAQ